MLESLHKWKFDGWATFNECRLQTAEENYAAIKGFFKEFPAFRENPIYIMGESYGGIYVPTLAARVVRGLAQFPINLKVLLQPFKDRKHWILF